MLPLPLLNLLYCLPLLCLPSTFHKRFFLKKISLKLLLSLLSHSGCSFIFSLSSSIMEFKVHGWSNINKKQKKSWALYDKWKIWIDASWLGLYNVLRLEKMQKRFISAHTFCINCFTLLISMDPFLLRLEIIFQAFMMVLSVMKLKSLLLNKNAKQIISHFY